MAADDIKFAYYMHDGSRIVKRGRWLTASETLLPAHYKSGFHIYTKKPKLHSIDKYGIIVRVRYRGGHTRGLQSAQFPVTSGGNVVVARQIYVPKRLPKQ